MTTPCEENPRLWGTDNSPRGRAVARHKCIYECPRRHTCATVALGMIDAHVPMDGVIAGVYFPPTKKRLARMHVHLVRQLRCIAEIVEDRAVA